MKQKIVIRVDVRCNKCRSKALGVAAKMHGVVSMAIEGEGKNQLVVVGDGVDAVALTKCLRKKMGGADILKVEAVSAEAPKPAAAAAAATPFTQPQEWCPGYYNRYYPPPATVHYYCP